MICGIFVEVLKTTFRFNDLLTRLNKLWKVIYLSGMVYYGEEHWLKPTKHNSLGLGWPRPDVCFQSLSSEVTETNAFFLQQHYDNVYGALTS